MVCQVCGNEIAASSSLCPWCNSRQLEPAGNGGRRPFRHQTVNLEQGLPLVEQALTRLQGRISEAREGGVQVLTIIHGYGSSGQGGAIRRECRKLLAHLQSQGALSQVVPGEQFNRRSGQARALIQRYPSLTRNRDFNRHNPGITLVAL